MREPTSSSANSTAASRKSATYASETWLVSGVGPEQAECVGVFPSDREQGPDRRLGVGELLAEAGHDPFEDGPIQVFLRVEVAVDDQPRDARGVGHVLHRRAVEAGLGEGRGRTPEDRLLALDPSEQLARRTCCLLYTREYTVRAMTDHGGTDAARVHRDRAAREPRLRGAADRRRRALPRRVRRRRRLRVAAHEEPRARHRGMAGAARAAVRHADARPPARRRGPSTTRTSPRSTYLLEEGVTRAAHLDAHPHRHGRGLRSDDPAQRGARPAAASSTRTSTAPRWPTSAAACTRRTPATRPASRTRPATSRCGSRRATSRSRRP